MNKEYSAFQNLKNNENRIKAQKIVLEKCWTDLKDKYQQNYKYYDSFFDLASNELFRITNFESLLVTINYQEVWFYFNIQSNFNDRFLGALEFFYNILYTAQLIAYKTFLQSYYRFENERQTAFERKFKIFQDFLSESKKFFDWIGYSLIESDNEENQESKYKVYFLVKKDIAKIIESFKIPEDLRTLLLELSKENLEIKDLESHLSMIYNNYLDNEKEQIKKCLGNKMHSNIFNLFNNGLIKHKDSKNINILDQFDEKEKLNALKWLKDIVLIYFAISRNNNIYPEKIINFKSNKNNAN